MNNYYILIGAMQGFQEAFLLLMGFFVVIIGCVALFWYLGELFAWCRWEKEYWKYRLNRLFR